MLSNSAGCTGQAGYSVERASGCVEAEQTNASARSTSSQQHVRVAVFTNNVAQRQRESDVLATGNHLKLLPPAPFFNSTTGSVLYVKARRVAAPNDNIGITSGGCAEAAQA